MELAWTNLDMVVKLFKKLWLGANAKDTKKRLHPTQKSVSLMKWCINLATKPGDTILDPFAGSGTTGVAAIQTGRNAILIERDPGYFAIMQKRIADAQQQMRLPLDV
jgi:DNA modification methylase